MKTRTRLSGETVNGRFMVKAKSISGWVYLSSRFDTAYHAKEFAKLYSKQWCCKTKAFFIEIDGMFAREVEVK